MAGPIRHADDPTESANTPSKSAARLILAAVAASSASGLMFEVALTRVFAVTQFYHFAFLCVSLALLGFGASGSVLTAWPQIGRGGVARWRWLLAAQSLTTVAAFVVTNVLPFDSFAIAWDRRQVAYLIVYYLALAIPFFFGGLLIAVLLAGSDGPRLPSHRVYAASLAGSGSGALLALVGLETLGGEATVFAAAALAMGAAALIGSPSSLRRSWIPLVAVAFLVVLMAWTPEALAMRLSPYKDLTGTLRFPGSTIVATDWDQGTRVDLVASEGIRSLPGLSLTHTGPPPLQDGVTFDGDDLSPVPRVRPEEADFADAMLSSLAFHLRPNAEALILEPRGGLDLVVALSAGSQSVVAVEPHPAVVRLIRESGPTVYDDSRTVVVHTTPRSFIERTEDRFDIIDLALTSPYRPVSSGAYSLAEEYQITVDAFARYLDRLNRGGIVTAMRWVQAPPSEEIRLLATASEALRSLGAAPAQSIVMARSYSTAVLVIAPDGFSESDLGTISAFLEANRFDLVAAPGFDPSLSNRFNVVPDEQYSGLARSILSADDPSSIYAAYEFEIAPPTDDHPFFGHFFKWSQTAEVLESLGRTWQPFGGAGFFVLIALLVISTGAAVTLIVLPMLIRRRHADPSPAKLTWWTLGYFSLLGIAFLFVEIPLLQQFILLAGQPATAFAVVLLALLVASGIGSAWSRHIPWKSGSMLLAVAALGYPLFIRALTPLVLPTPTWLRLSAAALMVAPLGFMMGIMFPWGVAHLERHNPGLVPWAWAINGTVSVISAAAAAVLSLTFGFTLVLRAGAIAYACCALLARTRSSLLSTGERNERDGGKALGEELPIVLGESPQGL